jgi:hypothetical protein
VTNQTLKLDEQRATVTIKAAVGGNGVGITQAFEDVTNSVTVTCTCHSGNQTYSTTTTCPGNNNTCDCSTPSSPRIICG